jgi:hypothetical protein
MCGLHLEALVERVACGRRLTLGQGLRNRAVREVLGPTGVERTRRFLTAYNASKHVLSIAYLDDENIEEEVAMFEDHLFSIEDAVVAYAVCRRLAAPLYSHASLKTARSWWGPFAGKMMFPPVPET